MKQQKRTVSSSSDYSDEEYDPKEMKKNGKGKRKIL